MIDLKDQDGKYLIRELVAIAKGPGSGWVDYKWPNPLTNKIEDKTSYVEKMGDYLVGVGVTRSKSVALILRHGSPIRPHTCQDLIGARR